MWWSIPIIPEEWKSGRKNWVLFQSELHRESLPQNKRAHKDHTGTDTQHSHREWGRTGKSEDTVEKVGGDLSTVTQSQLCYQQPIIFHVGTEKFQLEPSFCTVAQCIKCLWWSWCEQTYYKSTAYNCIKYMTLEVITPIHLI